MVEILAHVAPQGAAEIAGALKKEGISLTDKREAANYLVWSVHGEYEELRKCVAAMPHVRLVQLPSAGVDDFIAAGCIERRDVMYASCRGAFAVPVAEHAVALILGLLRRLHVRARARSWGRAAGTLLRDRDVVIVGRGGVGREVARLVDAFGARPQLLSREECAPSATGAQHRRAARPDIFLQALSRADVVVLCCPLTSETRGLIGARELSLMGEDAHLVNVARGPIVDTDALVHALRNDALAGAALDVTDPEPLPPDHALWSLPNCLITPHSADTPDMTFPLFVERARENAHRLRTESPLVGQIDIDKGY